VVSSSHVVSAAPSSSAGGLLRLFLCSNLRSLSLETVLHKLLQCESFRQAALLHKQPKRGSLPQCAVLQEQAAPAWVPMGSQVLPANLLQRGLLSLHRSTGPARSLLQLRLSMGSQPPLGTSTWSGVGSSTGCRWISAPLWTSMGCRGITCLTMVFITGCMGNSLLWCLEHLLLLLLH